MPTLQNIPKFPALFFFRFCFRNSTSIFYFVGLLLLLAIWPAFTFLLLPLCLSISYLNHAVHQDKKEIIEGFLPVEDSELLRYSQYFSPLFLLLVNSTLLCCMALLLWQLSSFWQTDLFSTQEHGLGSWFVYVADLVLKAVLFDIPEIYDINLSPIRHQGFWGSSVVLAMRLVILVLVVGSFFHWREICQMRSNSIRMLPKHPHIGQTRLLLLLQMYPRQLSPILKAIPKLENREISPLLQTLGKSGRSEVTTVLNKYAEHSFSIVQLSALKAMEDLGRGDAAIVKAILQESHSEEILQQACRTLGKWRTPESIALLIATIESSSKNQSVRIAAIESLGLTVASAASPFLVAVMRSQEYSKEERFAAKDALLSLRDLPQQQQQELCQDLAHSNSPANRRFAAMVIGGIDDLAGVVPLTQALERDDDGDTRCYCAMGMGNLAKKVTDENYQEQIWSEAFSHLRKISLVDPYPLARADAIRALGNVVEMLHYRPGPDLKEVAADLDEWLQSKDSAVVDAALDVSQRIVKCLENPKTQPTRDLSRIMKRALLAENMGITARISKVMIASEKEKKSLRQKIAQIFNRCHE